MFRSFLVILMLASSVFAQQKQPSKLKAHVSQEIKGQLDVFIACLKETMPTNVRETEKGFIKVRDIASQVKCGEPIFSDFANKPYAVKITWISNKQHSKIFSSKDDAEKTGDWLPVGKTAGSDDSNPTLECTVSLLWIENKAKWELEHMEWTPIIKGQKRTTKSTKRGDQHPWWDALKQAAKKQ